MSYVWAVVAFILGVIEFYGSQRPEWTIGWLIVSALFTIAGNVGYRRKDNG